MKKIIFSLMALCVLNFAKAQWTTSAPNIYYTGGNVGIGTSAPILAQLHVAADANSVQLRLERTGSSNGISADIGGNNSNLIFYPGGYYNKNGNVIFDTSGKIGIGTYSPQSNLDIVGDNAAFFVRDSRDINGSSATLRIQAGGQVQRLKYFWNDRFAIDTGEGGTEQFTIKRNGDIGIGTSSPSSSLHINTLDSRAMKFSRGSSNVFGFEIGGDTFGMFDYTNLEYKWRTSSGNVYLVENSGNVGIGTTTPNNKLEVNGTIRSQKVKVEATGWPDFVFAPNFKLRTLNELEAYITANQHLPEVPSAKEVEENGLDLGKMDATLLQKVEELTLYLIEINKKVERLEKENQELKKGLRKN